MAKSNRMSANPAQHSDVPVTLLTARQHEVLRQRPDSLRLQVLQGPDAGAEFKVKAGRVTVGRGPLCEVRLAHKSVSQRHLTLTLEQGAVSLRDLSSRNGTWIDKAQVTAATLHPGTEFYAGDCKLRLASIETAEVAVYREGRFGDVIGSSEVMRALFSKLERIAAAPLSVLLSGETGTGKEVVARSIHQASRREGRFVTIDCAALPRELAEGMLFGHGRGAFTGASSERPGPLEDAEGGTIFFDEIGELPIDIQPKLLRLLDGRNEVTRVGETKPRPVNVRVLAATNRDLAELVGSKGFRLDLYQRLKAVEVRLPALREHKEDVPELARFFLRRVAESRGADLRFSEEAVQSLVARKWEGNVRELKLTVERAGYLAEGPQVTAADVVEWEKSAAAPAGLEVLCRLPLKEATEQFQRQYLDSLLAEVGGDTRSAAERAGYSLRGLQTILQRLRERG